MQPNLILIFVFVLILFVIGVRYYLSSPKWIGKRGENVVRKVLNRLPEEYHVLNDVVLKTKTGTTQIDHVVVSKYGVFAIETKNYRGKIYGDDDKQEWKQIIVTPVTYGRKWWKVYNFVTKNTLYNPVKQSLGHAYEIKRHCADFPSLHVIPIVVFTGRADLSGVRSKYDVIDVSLLLSAIKRYQEVRYNDDALALILESLIKNDVREIVSDSEHVKNVRKTIQSSDSKIASGICPQCGGQLLRRKGRYGTFVGCSNYPRCKFTIND